ncbi:hypothetical protein [Haloferula helveola]|uniref:hypothetical protein n=1 Tax=Haloferula helveola TaxID=490095 RepID=UPI0030D46447
MADGNPVGKASRMPHFDEGDLLLLMPRHERQQGRSRDESAAPADLLPLRRDHI